jgi:hypothetical protein
MFSGWGASETFVLRSGRAMKIQAQRKLSQGGGIRRGPTPTADRIDTLALWHCLFGAK